jgi:hypothetical protein
MTFGSQVKKASLKIIDDSEENVRKTLIGIFANTIRGTPVDTGRLRNNWYTTLYAPSKRSKKGSGTSESPESPQNALMLNDKIVGKVKLGDKIYFTNNLPYAYITEYGGVVNGVRRSGNFMLTRAVQNASKS